MNEEEIVRKSLKELANSIFSKLNDVEKSYLLMVNNEKNKQINELQQELQRKDNEIKQLREDIVNHIKIASEYKEQMIIKDNNWNELKEWLRQETIDLYDKDNPMLLDASFTKYVTERKMAYMYVLDKIKELEGKGE